MLCLVTRRKWECVKYIEKDINQYFYLLECCFPCLEQHLETGLDIDLEASWNIGLGTGLGTDFGLKKRGVGLGKGLECRQCLDFGT